MRVNNIQQSSSSNHKQNFGMIHLNAHANPKLSTIYVDTFITDHVRISDKKRFISESAVKAAECLEELKQLVPFQDALVFRNSSTSSVSSPKFNEFKALLKQVVAEAKAKKYPKSKVGLSDDEFSNLNKVIDDSTESNTINLFEPESKFPGFLLGSTHYNR